MTKTIKHIYISVWLLGVLSQSTVEWYACTHYHSIHRHNNCTRNIHHKDERHYHILLVFLLSNRTISHPERTRSREATKTNSRNEKKIKWNSIYFWNFGGRRGGSRGRTSNRKHGREVFIHFCIYRKTIHIIVSNNKKINSFSPFKYRQNKNQFTNTLSTLNYTKLNSNRQKRRKNHHQNKWNFYSGNQNINGKWKIEK